MTSPLADDAIDWRHRALAVLTASSPAEKCAAARRACLASFTFETRSTVHPPDRPSRPDRPLLVPPAAVPRRKLGTETGRIALLHALAHIELNAIDLAFDMALRFADGVAAAGFDGREFVLDWFDIGREEASHFQQLSGRLEELTSNYGDLPAHDGLWEAAVVTADCVLARLAIAPMLLEARGLDATSDLAERLRSAGEMTSAAIVARIAEEEISHVARGVKWFERLCRRRSLAPEIEFQRLVAERFRGVPKPPFNESARSRAGLKPNYYDIWNRDCAAPCPK